MKVSLNKFRKVTISGILNTITAFFLILNCQSVWQRAADNNYHIYELCLVSIIINTMYQVIQWGISEYANKRFLIITYGYLFIIVLVVLFSVDNKSVIKFASRFLSYPFFVLLFSTKAPIKNKFGIIKKYIDLVSILSWITLLFWALSSIGAVKVSSIFKINWGVDIELANYYNLYFSSPQQYIDWIGNGVRRNIGIFAEGPMFMLVLVMALIFCLIIEREYNIKKWKIIGIILAIISTASVTGYIFLIIIIGIKIVQKNSNFGNKIIIGIVAFCLGLIGIYIFISMKLSTASFFIRVDDYLTGLKAWASSPVIGVGYENDDVLVSFMSARRLFNTGFSNTIFSVLAYGGVIFIIPFIIPIVRCAYISRKRNNMQMYMISIMYLGLYFTVIFYTWYVNYLMWAIFMLIYTSALKLDNE